MLSPHLNPSSSYISCNFYRVCSVPLPPYNRSPSRPYYHFLTLRTYLDVLKVSIKCSRLEVYGHAYFSFLRLVMLIYVCMHLYCRVCTAIGYSPSYAFLVARLLDRQYWVSVWLIMYALQ